MYEQVHPMNVDQVWHLVAPWIAQAIGDSDTWVDLAEIYKNAKLGHARIWIGRDLSNQIDMVLVTETWFLDGRRTLVLRWLCGKNMKEWLEDISLIEAWAQSNGFQNVHIWGRPGWIRVCESLGYKHEFTVLSKPLKRGLN